MRTPSLETTALKLVCFGFTRTISFTLLVAVLASVCSCNKLRAPAIANFSLQQLSIRLVSSTLPKVIRFACNTRTIPLKIVSTSTSLRRRFFYFERENVSERHLVLESTGVRLDSWWSVGVRWQRPLGQHLPQSCQSRADDRRLNHLPTWTFWFTSAEVLKCQVLGFFSTRTSVVPGNMGVSDYISALTWVQKFASPHCLMCFRYIRFFGGNPNKVTIGGQSAGGWSVSSITMTRQADSMSF